MARVLPYAGLDAGGREAERGRLLAELQRWALGLFSVEHLAAPCRLGNCDRCTVGPSACLHFCHDAEAAARHRRVAS